ncbi:MAG: hypothetical protein HY673_16400 [Chloroflexi bacterium]|nr:hypothetical protein [Chloroflexota bacterium]
MIKSFGTEVHELAFDLIAGCLSSRGIKFDWDEKDRATPGEAWGNFQSLSELDRWKIADEICGETCGIVTKSIMETLSADMRTVEKRVSEVEVLLKTTQDEMFLFSYPNVQAAARALLGLLTDRPDVTEHLR